MILNGEETTLHIPLSLSLCLPNKTTLWIDVLSRSAYSSHCPSARVLWYLPASWDPCSTAYPDLHRWEDFVATFPPAYADAEHPKKCDANWHYNHWAVKTGEGWGGKLSTEYIMKLTSRHCSPGKTAISSALASSVEKYSSSSISVPSQSKWIAGCARWNFADTLSRSSANVVATTALRMLRVMSLTCGWGREGRRIH